MVLLDVLETVYSGPFFLGAFIGTLFWLLYCHGKARYLDHHDPLPEGKKHAVARYSRQWIAGLCLVGTVGYVLLATGKTEKRTTDLNLDVQRCWSETYQQIKAQVELNAQNDQISRQQQALQREYDEDTSTWIKNLINPPGDLRMQSTDSPARQQWGIDQSIIYQGQLDDLGKRFDTLVAQRGALDAERAKHQLPPARCGAKA